MTQLIYLLILLALGSETLWSMEGKNLAISLPLFESNLASEVLFDTQGEYMGTVSVRANEKESVQTEYNQVIDCRLSRQNILDQQYGFCVNKSFKGKKLGSKRYLSMAVASDLPAIVIGSRAARIFQDKPLINDNLAVVKHGNVTYLKLDDQTDKDVCINNIAVGSLYTKPVICANDSKSGNVFFVTEDHKTSKYNYEVHRNLFNIEENDGIAALRVINNTNSKKFVLCALTNSNQMQLFDIDLQASTNKVRTIFNFCRLAGAVIFSKTLTNSMVDFAHTDYTCVPTLIDLPGEYTQAVITGENKLILQGCKEENNNKKGPDTTNCTLVLDVVNSDMVPPVTLSAGVYPYAHYSVLVDINKNKSKNFIVGSETAKGKQFILKQYAVDKADFESTDPHKVLFTADKDEFVIGHQIGVKLLKNSLFFVTNKRFIKIDLLASIGENIDVLHTFTDGQVAIKLEVTKDNVVVQCGKKDDDRQLFSFISYFLADETVALCNAHTASKNQEYVTNIRKLSDQLISAKKEVETAVQNADQIKEEIARCKADLKEKDTDNQKLTQEIQKSKEDGAKLEESNKKTKKELEITEKARQTLQERCANQEKQLKQLEDKALNATKQAQSSEKLLKEALQDNESNDLRRTHIENNKQLEQRLSEALNKADIKVDQNIHERKNLFFSKSWWNVLSNGVFGIFGFGAAATLFYVKPDETLSVFDKITSFVNNIFTGWRARSS